MCIATAGLIVTAVGTGIGAIGAIQQGEATAANAKYQAAVARNNQIIAEQNAQYASQAGAATTTRAQLKQREVEGEVGAALGASGIDMNTGSPVAVRSATSEVKQLDTATTAQDAALKVYGFRTQGTNYGAESQLKTQEASQASTAGLISGGSTLLSGLGGLASKWSAWQVSNANPTAKALLTQ